MGNEFRMRRMDAIQQFFNMPVIRSSNAHPGLYPTQGMHFQDANKTFK
jgi:hypothetical protein